MGDETSKAVRRRLGDPWWAETVFVGHGLDIGSGSDPLSKHAHKFPKILSVRDWDLNDGDGQELEGVENASFDFIHSSHCLEHLRDPYRALVRWLEVVKPGGHVVVTVPDWELYEQGIWPSRFNPDHKWAFTTDYRIPRPAHVLNVSELMYRVHKAAPCEGAGITLLDQNYRHNLREIVDQTSAFPDVEAAIEFVLLRTR